MIITTYKENIALHLIKNGNTKYVETEVLNLLLEKELISPDYVLTDLGQRKIKELEIYSKKAKEKRNILRRLQILLTFNLSNNDY
jgi:hypothetical protein